MRASKLFSAAAAAVVLMAAFSAMAREELVSPNAWRDSEIDYEHTFSAYSLDKSAQPTYQPYYAHRLYLMPYWHFNDFFVAKARLVLEQELTDTADTGTTYKHEVTLSDLSVDTSFKGITEPYSGIKFNGGIRWTFPTSKAAQAQTMYMAIGPAVAVERTFPLLEGLTLSYSARMTFYINKYRTAQATSSWVACGTDTDSPSCAQYVQIGTRNPWGQVRHGPDVKLGIIPKLNFEATFTFTNSYLYSLDGPTVLGDDKDVKVRYSQWLQVWLSYDVTDYAGVSLGVSTEYGDLSPDGTYRTPFLNRFSQVYLSLSFLIDPVISKFL
jgi:hypothetical protein